MKAFRVSTSNLVEVEEENGQLRLRDIPRLLSDPPGETLLQMSERVWRRSEELSHEGCDNFCLRCAFQGLSRKLRLLHELKIGS